MENTKTVLSIEDVSHELGIARNLIYAQARTGKMHGWIRVGDRWLISTENFRKFINGESQVEAGTIANVK